MFVVGQGYEPLKFSVGISSSPSFSSFAGCEDTDCQIQGNAHNVEIAMSEFEVHLGKNALQRRSESGQTGIDMV